MLRVCLRRKRKGVFTVICAVFGIVAMCMVVGSLPGNLHSYGDRTNVLNDYDMSNYELGDLENGAQGVQALVRHVKFVKRTATENVELKNTESPESRTARAHDVSPKRGLPIPVFNYKREEVFPQEVNFNEQLSDIFKRNKTNSKPVALPKKKPLSGQNANALEDIEVRNLVIEDNTSDDDNDDDDDYTYDYNYPENPRFKLSDFDLRNFTAFQGEDNQVAYDTQHSQNEVEDLYQYEEDTNPALSKESHNVGPPDSKVANHSVIHRPGINRPCKSPGDCGDGVNLEADTRSKARRVSHEGLALQAGAPILNAKQLADKHHKQQNPNTSGGDYQQQQEDRPPNRAFPKQDNGVRTPVRTLKRADLNTYMYQSKIETQIPLQDGMDVNILGVHQPATQIQMPQLPWQPGEVRSKQGMPLVVNRIYWSKEVEDLVPKGVTDLDIQHFLHKISSNHVREMQEPLWNRCGRPKNQYVTLDDGTQLCARYRDPHNKLIQGEILTFHLAHLLGLDNVPVVVLTQVNSSAAQWRGHEKGIAKAGWQEGRIAAFIQWVDGLEFERSRVRMPTVISDAYERGQPVDWHHVSLTNLSADQLSQIIQWGDMILLDYLTGHYDRVASMQDGADREHKPSIMQESIRNLRQWQTGKLWLIDNESGLFDSYDLMYRGGETGSRFITFHLQMLKTMCIFHKSFADKLQELSELERPAEALVTYTKAQEPLYSHLPHSSEYGLFQKYFHTRLKEVVSWIENCRSR